MAALTKGALMKQLANLSDDCPIIVGSFLRGENLSPGNFRLAVDMELAHVPDDIDPEYVPATLDVLPHNTLVIWSAPGMPEPVDETGESQWFLVDMAIKEHRFFAVQAETANDALNNYGDYAAFAVEPVDTSIVIDVSIAYPTRQALLEAELRNIVEWDE